MGCRVILHLANISARRESLFTSRQHNHMNGIIRFKLLKSCIHLINQLVVQSVQRLRAIERYNSNVVFHVDDNILENHMFHF